MKRYELPSRFAKAHYVSALLLLVLIILFLVFQKTYTTVSRLSFFFYFNEHTRNNNLWNQKNWNKLIQFNSIKEEPKIFGEKKNIQMLSIDDNTNLLRNDE